MIEEKKMLNGDRLLKRKKVGQEITSNGKKRRWEKKLKNVDEKM